ncbi:hypothetical protein [Salinithrix halophila]|uniref:Membrane protein involved in the export of O-antigen and teichoic acid n=1 Tax=Salinithrix halophila TaxID=1485204 RepID=A0ABV8JEX7_9BACL
MDFAIYRKLYRKAMDESEPKGLQWKEVAQHFLFALVLFLILSLVLGTFNVDPGTVIGVYLALHIIMDLLFLFSTTQLYETSNRIMGFLRHVPITVRKIFLYHFLCSGISVSFFVEIGVVSLTLLHYGASGMEVLMLYLRLQAINFIRVFLDLFIPFANKVKINAVTWSVSIFGFAMLMQIFVGTGLIGPVVVGDVYLVLDILLLSGCLVASLFYPVVIKGMLIDGREHNSSTYVPFTGWFASVTGKLFNPPSRLSTLVRMQMVRLIRDPEYINKLLGVGIIVFIFSSINTLFLEDWLGSSEHLGGKDDLLYFSFFISLLGFYNLRLEFSLTKRHHLEYFPVLRLLERLSLDIAHGILLWILAALVLSLQVVIDPGKLPLLSEAIIAYVCFYLIGLGVEIPGRSITKGNKWVMYLQFFALATVVEIAFLIPFVFWVDLLILALCFAWLYLRVYRKLLRT